MLLFIDVVTPTPYNPGNIDVIEVGASEKSAMMIAEYLSRSNTVYFAQKGEKVSYTTGVKYIPVSELKAELNPSVIFIIRKVQLLPQIASLYPKAQYVMILDDLYNSEEFKQFPCNIPVKFICKSKWHMEHIKTCLEMQKLNVDIDYIYNPIQYNSIETEEIVDKDKLLFASSPNKGLEYTIQVFNAIKKHIPELKLHVANPGYIKDNHPPFDGVKYLDKLTYHDLQKEMKTSLCLFYPNIKHPETFGCVPVEANYAGTPVLSHPFGALPEVLNDADKQLVNCKNPTAIYKKLVEWRENRPKVSMKKEFDIENVGDRYNKLVKEMLSRNNDLTEIYLNVDDTPMNILMIHRTSLANAPHELAKAINKHTPHHVELSHTPKAGFNILHYHNVYIPAKHQHKLIQYHSEPGRVTRRDHFAVHNKMKDWEFPEKELVLCQYHATLDYYKGCIPVQNVINFDEPEYDLSPTESSRKIKIGFSPSITSRQNEYADKGYDATKLILESLNDKFDVDIITNVNLEECIKRKRDCDIIIDECITGSYHRSGLEGLALGKMTICYLNEQVENMLKKTSGSDIVPFENIRLENLLQFLVDNCSDKKTVQEKGKQNREWMEKYWHPKQIALGFVDIYKSVLNEEKNVVFNIGDIIV